MKYMPDKFRSCGNGCLRCWRNKLKHGVRHKVSKTSLDFQLVEPIQPAKCKRQPSPKTMSAHEIHKLWNNGSITDHEMWLDILSDRKPSKDTNYLIKVLSRSIMP